MPWTLARAKHLYRRAGFGATWSELKRSLQDGAQESVSRMLAGRARHYAVPEDFEDVSAIIRDAAVNSNDPERLKAWWLYRMLFTNDPLGEQLTLMWHNHFATSNLKVRSLSMMCEQNELFRRHSRGSFGELLQSVLHDRAMLSWLDADSNRKQHPNENLARELMELFTLGVGKYTEKDVRESARALTGWSVKNGRTVLRMQHHDAGHKTVLGKQGMLGLEDLTAILIDEPATWKRLAWRLCDHFLGEGVPDEAIDALAVGLREHDLEIGWAVETILRSEFFFRGSLHGSQVRSPVSHVVGTVRSLQLLDSPPSTLRLAIWCARLGQDLFYPPNVGGWDGGRAWLTTRTIVARSNFAADLVQGRLWSPAERPRFHQLRQTLLEDHGSLAQLLLCENEELKENTAPSADVGREIQSLLSQPNAFLN